MPGAFTGLSISSSALKAFQRGLDTVGHNIANAQTRGYSRQVVDFGTLTPTLLYQGSPMFLGNGVNVASINRVRDMFLEARRREVSSESGRLDTLVGNLQGVEGVFREPGDLGISSALDGFFNAFSALASNPSEGALKVDLQYAGRTLTDRVRGAYADLKAMDGQVKQQMDVMFGEIQSRIDVVAKLNEDIRYQFASGGVPNDLLDQRDQAIKELSEMVDIHVVEQPDRGYAVSLNGKALVDQLGANKFPTDFDASSFTLSDGVQNVTVRSGQLRGMFETINSIAAYQTQLDTLANTLRTEINNVHMTGTNGAGATGLRFFNDADPPASQTGAVDFGLDTVGVLGPPASDGVGNDANAIATGVTGAAGDGGLAQVLANLRDLKIAGLGNRTFGEFYTGMIGDLGRNISYQKSSQNTQAAISDQVENMVQSSSGVSLDEEMTDMMRLQRSYQAAARALSTFDQVTQDLLGLLS